jgi:exodeoxyribonuclease-5
MAEITLTPAQQVAYDALLPVVKGESKHRTAVLEGSAGTGKSFLVAQLLSVVAGSMAIAVAAPTNKAVRVMKSMLEAALVAVASAGEDEGLRSRVREAPAMGCTLKSIHSFLGLQMKELDNGKQEAHKARDSNISDYHLLIIDEASMLSEDLFGRVMLEREHCRVLFVGDPAQLPPINGHGALSPVFHSGRVGLQVRLSEVVRQAADNPIIKLSMQLRALIEADVRADPLTLLQCLPAVETGPKAALLAGTPDDLVTFFLDERAVNPDSDVRIIAYTNSRVLDYNRRIHRALYGETRDKVFVPGEPVIIHTQGNALMYCGRDYWVYAGADNDVDKWFDGGDRPCDESNGWKPVWESQRLITSEELTVLKCEVAAHPFYPEIHANRVLMKNALGEIFEGYVPIFQSQLDQQVDALFREWRGLKMRAEQASGVEHDVLKEKAADASGQGWALRRSFLNLRHAYALTTHKSQGSSFDCALVDFTDLSKMPDAFEFNRALYVAVTRSREFLALVVT